ncbi:hypothetical protein CSKR_114149, partial [Clonorchis sinensis]
FSQPVTSDTIYIDKMINDAQAIPKIFLREAPTHISIYNSSDLIPGTSSRIPNGEVWASTFANWKAETDLKIQVEDEHVETVMVTNGIRRMNMVWNVGGSSTGYLANQWITPNYQTTLFANFRRRTAATQFLRY